MWRPLWLPLRQEMFRKKICIKEVCVKVYILKPFAGFIVIKVDCPCYWIKLSSTTSSNVLLCAVVKLETLLWYIIKLEKFPWRDFTAIKNQASSSASFCKVKNLRNVMSMSYQMLSNCFKKEKLEFFFP